MTSDENGCLACVTCGQPVETGAVQPPTPEPLSERVWKCKIGAKVGELPSGADWPLRVAAMEAFKALTGYECEFIFSGWGAEVSPLERAVINNDDDAAIAAATPPAGEQSLTDEQIYEIAREHEGEYGTDMLGFARAIIRWSLGND